MSQRLKEGFRQLNDLNAAPDLALQDLDEECAG